MVDAQSMDLLIRGGLSVTMNPDRQVWRRGYIAVRDGTIVAVGDDATCHYAARETVDAADRVVLPGFVNAHTHLIGSFSRGMGGERFVNVAPAAGDRLATRVRENMDEETCYHAAKLALLDLQKSGVTTTAESQPGMAGLERNADGTLRAIHESRIRALYSRSSLNRTEFVASRFHDSLDRAIPELDRLRARWADDRIEIAAEAQGLHRVEEDLLKGLKEWSRRNGAHFAMHISYSQEAAAHAVERFGRRLLLLLMDWGVLDDRFLGFHPVWVDDDEIAALAETGAGVAYCPVDNMLIASGVAPVGKLLAAGVRLGIGIDQPNDGHNFFELMKYGMLLQRVHFLDPTFGSPELALEVGTLGGARALHREHEVGSLEPGKAADIVVMDARRAPLNPFPGRLSNVVYAAGPSEVDSVYVGGEAVVRSGRHALWDEEVVVGEANRAMAATLRRAGVAEDVGPHTSWPLK
jgi:5-methylthioadenosine/S-adenosylhomocysteine deaminase